MSERLKITGPRYVRVVQWLELPSGPESLAALRELERRIIESVIGVPRLFLVAEARNVNETEET